MIIIIHFFDGAFGTYYFKKTGSSQPCELANISNPDLVKEIHQEYIKSGATAIKTNTFGVSPRFYNDEALEKLIAEGYNLAKEAAHSAEKKVKVYADIGSIYASNLIHDEVEKDYLKIAEIFIRLEAKHFLFETLYEFEMVKPALAFIKSKIPDCEIIVSFAVSQDGYSRKGLYYKNLISEAENDPHVDAVGLNCLCGPAHLSSLAKKLGKLTKPLSIMPNAGYPSSLNGRTFFQDNAEYFAETLVEIHRSGVNILGGCCGTTPKHIELSVKAIHSYEENRTNPPQERPVVKKAIDNLKPTNRLPLKPLLIELDPPINDDCGFILSAAEKLKACGVTALTLTDSPLAKVRADSILTAAKIKTLTNIDVIPHLTCRDKNRLAIKASLLGASFFDIDKILVITGDPVCDSNYKKSGVYDFNSKQLISYINSLNQEIFTQTALTIGGALNLNAINFECEIIRCHQKIENGATFLMSQPIFTDYAVENLNIAKKALACDIYAGILPVASYRNALFLNNEVSGIEIPDEIVENLKDKPTDEVYEISVEYSRRIIEQIYHIADGFYIMTPLRKVDLVTKLIRRCFDV